MLAFFLAISLQRHSGCIFLVKAAVHLCCHGVDFNVSVPKQTYIFRPAGTWGSNCDNGNFEDDPLGFVLGVDFSESQAVDPVPSAWRGSFFYVFAFLGKTDRHCSVNF